LNELLLDFFLHDIKRQHAKEIGNAWGAMISHSDMRVERIKGDPYFQKKKEGNEMETGKFDDTSKQKSLFLNFF
jgi:hypothetical protein